MEQLERMKVEEDRRPPAPVQWDKPPESYRRAWSTDRIEAAWEMVAGRKAESQGIPIKDIQVSTKDIILALKSSDPQFAAALGFSSTVFSESTEEGRKHRDRVRRLVDGFEAR
eukprot:5211879-Prymnesium_polylepis.1